MRPQTNAAQALVGLAFQGGGGRPVLGRKSGAAESGERGRDYGPRRAQAGFIRAVPDICCFPHLVVQGSKELE